MSSVSSIHTSLGTSTYFCTATCVLLATSLATPKVAPGPKAVSYRRVGAGQCANMFTALKFSIAGIH